MPYRRITLVAVVAAATVTLGSSAWAATTPITACNQTVTTNAALTHDLSCTGDGIVIGAGGITIDLKGFTVQGDRGSGDYGIDDSGGWDNLTIKNGVLRNFDPGMYAAPADKVTVNALAPAVQTPGPASNDPRPIVQRRSCPLLPVAMSVRQDPWPSS